MVSNCWYYFPLLSEPTFAEVTDRSSCEIQKILVLTGAYASHKQTDAHQNGLKWYYFPLLSEPSADKVTQVVLWNLSENFGACRSLGLSRMDRRTPKWSQIVGFNAFFCLTPQWQRSRSHRLCCEIRSENFGACQSQCLRRIDGRTPKWS